MIPAAIDTITSFAAAGDHQTGFGATTGYVMKAERFARVDFFQYVNQALLQASTAAGGADEAARFEHLWKHLRGCRC